MRLALNDGLRFLIGACLRMAGALAEVRHRMRARFHAFSRARLRRRLGIRPETPLATELPQVGLPGGRSPGGSARVAYTSGTGGDPKVLVYSRRRLASVRWVFIESFMRVFWMLGVRRTSLYVFGPLEGDESLTGLLLSEGRLPGYLTTLQAPYRLHACPEVRRLAEDYGDAAVRLWILALSNPGVLYSTNPSTMSAFLDRLDSDWERCSALVRDCVLDPERVGSVADAVTRRLGSLGHAERLEHIARAELAFRSPNGPRPQGCMSAGPAAISFPSSIDWRNIYRRAVFGWFRCTPCPPSPSRQSRISGRLTWPSCPWRLASTTSSLSLNPRENLAGCSLRSSSRWVPRTSWWSATATA